MKQLFLYTLLVLPIALSAQEKDSHLPKANDEFLAKKFADAESNYRISGSDNPKKAIASYNLGNAIYKQKQMAEAKLSFEKAIKLTSVRPEKHSAFHNLGNVYMNDKKYTEAVEAYKNALRNNPADEQTRYNFALAKKMLKDNPPKKDKNKDNKDKNKDNKEQKDKDGDKEKKDNKGDEKKDDKKGEGDKDKKENKENKGNEPDKPKPNPGGIPKQRMQNLLDAVNNEEKKIQDKVNKNKVKGKPVQTEKDW
jgi:tetratricopeptide (TPR) repeat protein